LGASHHNRPEATVNVLLQSWLPASDKKKPGLRGSGPGFYFLLSLPGMKRVAHDCEPRAQCQKT